MKKVNVIMRNALLSNSLNAVSSVSNDGLVCTDYANDSILKDQAFSIREVFTLPDASVKNLIIDPSNYPGEKIFCLPIIFKTSLGRIDISFANSDNFTYTDLGLDTLYITNRQGVIDASTYTQVYENPTDVVIPGNSHNYFIGGEPTNQSSAGGLEAGQVNFIIYQNHKYLFQITNNSGAIARVSFAFDFYETGQ